MKKSLSFWAFVLLPWILELVYGTRFFSSLLGSILWTSIVMQGLIRAQVLDQRLRRALFTSTVFTFVIWSVFWFIHLAENPDAHFGAGIPHLEAKFWIQLHIALLTASIASSIAVFAASALGVLQERRLRSDSWKRRGQGIPLPSLESLQNAARFSARTGFVLWSLGSILAAMTLAFKSPTGISFKEILFDEQIIGVVGFWIVHLATVLYAPKIFGGDRPNRGYLFFSLFFLLSFVIWTMTKQSNFHTPLRWLTP